MLTLFGTLLTVSRKATISADTLGTSPAPSQRHPRNFAEVHTLGWSIRISTTARIGSGAWTSSVWGWWSKGKQILVAVI